MASTKENEKKKQNVHDDEDGKWIGDNNDGDDDNKNDDEDVGDDKWKRLMENTAKDSNETKTLKYTFSEIKKCQSGYVHACMNRYITH